MFITESSLLLHVVSLSSRSDDGFEITSRSRLFLEDLSDLLSDMRLGAPGVYRKRDRPHYRMYVSEKKVEMLRKYAFLYSRCPGLKNWLRIPLNQIEEELLFKKEDVSPESICRKELSKFVESILRSLDRRRSRESSRGSIDLLQYKAEITDYFWQQDLIPSIDRVEKLLENLLHEAS